MRTFDRKDARILVVDDEPTIVRLLTRGLTGAGYAQVTGLVDSTMVLDHLDKHSFDLVVVDLTMPGIDGFQLIEQITARLPEDTYLPVLVLSGLQDQRSKERAFRAGAKDYLTKPVDMREFLLHADALLATRFMSQRVLSASEFKFRTVADFAYDWEYWADEEGGFIWVSPSVERVIGYSAADFLANPGLLQLIVHPDDRQLVAAHLADAAHDDTAPLDFRIVTKAGDVRWIAHVCHPVTDRDGRSLGRRASNRDITDRKLAEELLRLTQFSVDRAADSVFWLDSEGQVLYVSEATCEALGYSRDELLATTIFQVDPTLSGGRYRKNWATIKESGTYSLETVHRKKDGTDLPVEVTLNYVKFEGKEYNCVFARDITARKKTEAALEETLTRLRESQATIIQVLSSVTELRDPYTAGHQQRVAEICVNIAARLNLPPEQVEGLEVAALLHDVGKVSIPLEVLSIPGKFSPLQRMLVEGHVAAGYEILRPIYLPWPVADITLQHHERLDGSGYPSRLTGDQIMLEARILAVADTFEAMTTHRPYRPAVEAEAALNELRLGKGKLFDGEVVDALCTLVNEGVVTPRSEPDLSELAFLL